MISLRTSGRRAAFVVVLASTAVANSFGCGGAGHNAHLAHVKEGAMPSGESFTGVWFNPTWGELHMVQNGSTITGRWKSDSHGVWGQMTGTTAGDVIHFEWEEHKTGAIGPGAVRNGHGYFKYVPVAEPDLPRLDGEWGLGDNEIGGGEWNATKEKDVAPKLEQIGGGGDPMLDSGWDKPITNKQNGPKK